jgi:hypothetical protein
MRRRARPYWRIRVKVTSTEANKSAFAPGWEVEVKDEEEEEEQEEERRGEVGGIAQHQRTPGTHTNA